MTKSQTTLPIAMAAAGLLALSTIGTHAEESSKEDHHPAGAANQESQGGKPGAAPAPSADAKNGGGMMGGDQMPMMKMMHEMHQKMMGSGMARMPKGDTGPSSMAFNGIMAKMHQDMQIAYTGNADIDFVKAMIPHHQAAVEMAKTVLAFGKEPEVKKFAEGVLNSHGAAIAWSNEWLKKQGQ